IKLSIRPSDAGHQPAISIAEIVGVMLPLTKVIAQEIFTTQGCFPNHDLCLSMPRGRVRNREPQSPPSFPAPSARLWCDDRLLPRSGCSDANDASAGVSGIVSTSQPK